MTGSAPRLRTRSVLALLHTPVTSAPRAMRMSLGRPVIRCQRAPIRAGGTYPHQDVAVAKRGRPMLASRRTSSGAEPCGERSQLGPWPETGSKQSPSGTRSFRPELGLHQAAIMGLSLGGAVALRTAIQHPALVEQVVVVSTVCKRQGWHPEMVAGLDAMGPAMAEHLRQTPLYEIYAKLAPDVTGWPVLVEQVSELVKLDYDWSAEIRGLPMPVMLVIGDADGSDRRVQNDGSSPAALTLRVGNLLRSTPRA